MKYRLQNIMRRTVPLSLRRRIAHAACWPPVGWLRFGHLRRVQPINRDWGRDRGLPVDRYYITQFLANHASDIQGHVLEISNNTYTGAYGGDRVTQSDVLHVSEHHSNATIVADLTCAGAIPSASFDCVILTQTLQCIYDVPAALKTVNRILKPGGVALVTVPGITKICRYDMDRWGQYWCFTSKSVQRLFTEAFPAAQVHIQAYGNVLAAMALLHGIATEELRRQELDYFDPDYEMLITIRAEQSRCHT